MTSKGIGVGYLDEGPGVIEGGPVLYPAAESFKADASILYEVGDNCLPQ